MASRTLPDTQSTQLAPLACNEQSLASDISEIVGKSPIVYFSPAPIPAALQACSLSRSIAKKRWTLAFQTHESPAMIWIDYHLDKLVIGVGSVYDSANSPRASYFKEFYQATPKEDLAKVENLQIVWGAIIFLRTVENQLMDAELSEGRVAWLMGSFPLLKRLRICWKGRGDLQDLQDWRQWHRPRDRVFLQKIQRVCGEKGCALEFVKLEV